MAWHRIFLVFLILLSTPVWAGVDGDMEKSLHSFFSHGVYSNGAKAELVEVLRWPDATGVIHWRMPHLGNHPSQISLIAEKNEGKILRRWYVPVRLRWWSDAVVAKTDLPARTMLTNTMLAQKRVNIANHTGTWWKDTNELVGTVLTRPLRAGQVIHAPYIKRPRLLKRGDQVAIIAYHGGLKVKASGKIMRSAGLGERIQVQNISSKKVLQAIVLDADTVRVVSGGTN